MKYLKNVTSLKLDKEKCNGCQICTQVCPHKVFSIENGKAAIKYLDNCMECGACALNCKQQAITVNIGVGCATAILQSQFSGKKVCCSSDNSDDVISCGC